MVKRAHAEAQRTLSKNDHYGTKYTKNKNRSKQRKRSL